MLQVKAKIKYRIINLMFIFSIHLEGFYLKLSLILIKSNFWQ